MDLIEFEDTLYGKLKGNYFVWDSCWESFRPIDSIGWNGTTITWSATSYTKHIFDEWFEETYLDMIHEKMGRNDITIDTIDELTGRPDVCVPTQTKPDEITDEEMIEYIMKNTLYRREHIEKNESEEPGWIEDLYLKKLRKNKHDELRGY